MIERLRRRFVAVTMAAATVVIVLVGLAVNGAGYWDACSRADAVLQVIAANGGSIPRDSRQLGPEAAFSSRYFVVTVAPDGAEVSLDLSHVAAVTANAVADYVRFAADAPRGYGWHGDYRYLVEESGSLRTAVFLDCRSSLASLRSVALASVAVAVGADLLVYGLVRLISLRAIDPLVKAAQRQQRFVTDASHELKTPLTVIVTSLKVLEMEVGQNRWIEKAQRQSASLAELIDQLIVLARLEDEEGRPREAVDLSALVAEAAGDFADFAEAEGHGLEVSVAPAVAVTGDRRALTTLLSLLLDNAVKYALPGAPIAVGLVAEHRRARLRVSNPAAPMDPEDIARLFDRFYRPDSARSRETGGFGIGLAQARAIVEAHGGTVEAGQAGVGEEPEFWVEVCLALA